MNECDAGWAAGFLDGEGQFKLRVKTERDRIVPRYIVEISAVQVRKAPLLKLQALFGGVVKPRRIDDSAGWQPQWIWIVAGARGVRRVVENILPHLVVKAGQAQALLDVAETMRPGVTVTEEVRLRREAARERHAAAR